MSNVRLSSLQVNLLSHAKKKSDFLKSFNAKIYKKPKYNLYHEKKKRSNSPITLVKFSAREILRGCLLIKLTLMLHLTKNFAFKIIKSKNVQRKLTQNERNKSTIF